MLGGVVQTGFPCCPSQKPRARSVHVTHPHAYARVDTLPIPEGYLLSDHVGTIQVSRLGNIVCLALYHLEQYDCILVVS